MNNYTDLERQLPVIPLKGHILFPGNKNIIKLNGEVAEKIKNHTESGHKHVLALALRDKKEENILPENLCKTGVILLIESMDSGYKSLNLRVKALERAGILDFNHEEGLLKATFDLLPDIDDMDERNKSDMLSYLKEQANEIATNFEGSERYLKEFHAIESVPEILNNLMQYITLSQAEKQAIMEIRSLQERSMKILDALLAYKENVKLQVEMAKKFTEKTSKNYRESVLREQLIAIRKELGEIENEEGEPEKTLKEKIETSHMPEEVKKKALEENHKLENQGAQNPDSGNIKNYLDLLLALPWKSEPYKDFDLPEARSILDRDHYGLDKVKERIIQHLAVMKLKKDKKGSILLLVGPPGTGKTSLGKSIAEAMDREFVRMSLGGIKDEADIRGHRRTYVGSLPGRIIQGMKKAGKTNPVFVLDEIDKLMTAYAGDPASALLEVLDPEQNNTFADHYMEVPYDLSDVFFIATANSLSGIPGPLLDRMETINISGYTNNEKYEIAWRHLIDKVLDDHGIRTDKINLSDEALMGIIENYTREAGVRSLKRQLATLSRVLSEKIVNNPGDDIIEIGRDDLHDLLGKEEIRHDVAGTDNPPGVVTGMAWTPVGGEILFVEGSYMPGNGQLTLTGQLGDVMKESARISLSLVRSWLAPLTAGFNFSEMDIHLHIPSGAVQKDGPSAGAALFTTIASLILGRKVDSDISMTGEITLRGAILPVGGVKEKIIAAHRAGIRKILLPADNERDLEDIPEEIRNSIDFQFLKDIGDVLKQTMDLTLPSPPWMSADLSINSNDSHKRGLTT